MDAALAAVLEGGSHSPLNAPDALALAELDWADLDELMRAAATRRDAHWGSRLTYSPKVFLPLTNLCRNVCDYCTFRRSGGEAGAHTMADDEVEACLREGARHGATEALLCLGDRPETAFASYRRELARRGHTDTIDLIARAARAAIEGGLLPHTNAGLLDRRALERLRPLNASMGLMLENVSPRLCEPGMPHHRARDKRPEKRMAMTRLAGELRIPFTSGILLGIGETRRERVESLLAIREAHAQHGHIQEVIVQGFRAKPETPMADAPTPSDFEIAHAVAVARLVLPDEVSVQAPPNLAPGATELLVHAGINDFGGISPVTPDFINPECPWPRVNTLAAQVAPLGFTLEARLPVYPRYLNTTWVDPALWPRVRAAQASLGAHGALVAGGSVDGRGQRARNVAARSR